MTLIKCPSCNHTILSLASRCPNCGFHLTQPRFQQGLSGSLAECKKCGRKVLSRTRQCPYCGAEHPARTSRIVLALGAAGVVGAFALLVVVAQQLQPRPPALGPATREILEPPAGAAALPASGPREDAPEPAAGGASESPPQREGAVPAAGAFDSPLQPARSEVAGSRLISAPEGGVVRWVSNWANVREGRSLESAVLQVLPPGRQVVVANRVAGWWEVYLDGRFAGYIAGSLLLSELPDTLIPRP
ncbi:hypothetical protein HRbin33_01637 [bacterium HR33]|nr:hypothetical protein HRbin33_01637 [bacterium HR33]